jgi:hypothetical protein
MEAPGSTGAAATRRVIGKHLRWKRSDVMAWFDEHLDEVSRGI